MNWERSELQVAIAELAGRVLSSSAPQWQALVDAGMLDLTSLVDQATLLIEVGRAGGRVPVLPTVILGAPLSLLPEPPPSGTILTAGLVEPGSRDPRHCSTYARAGQLFGQKICVPAVQEAGWMVVPAQDGLYGVRLEDAQVSIQRGTEGVALGQVTFDGTPCHRLGGTELLEDWLARVDVGVCALLLGLAQKALSLTASYVCERKQFERPIGSFQAVQHRAADAWIDTQVMEVSLWQAAWRVEAGLPSDKARAIARYWASEGAHRVTAAAQHLHGGFGFDRDYALHRQFLGVKQWEFLLGGANSALEHLGELLSTETIAAPLLS